MRFRDLALLVVSNLRRMKLRLALTSLGVVIGTSAIVLMVSLGIGLQDNLVASLGDLGAATHITVLPGSVESGPIAVSMEDGQLTDATVEQFAAIEHVEAVMPTVYVMSAQGMSYKRYQSYSGIMGAPMDAFETFGYVLESGRLPRTDSEIVLGAAVPTSFSPEGDETLPGRTSGGMKLDLLGKRLEVTVMEWPTDEELVSDPMAQGTESTLRFTVVGVIAPTDMQTDQSAFVTLESALDMNKADRRRVTYENLTVKADSTQNVTAVSKTIEEQGYFAFSAQSMQEQLNIVFFIIQGVLGALGAIAMLVAALGIANTMTMSIYERTREIGIMKAVGASNRQVKRVFLGEAAIIGVLGGIGGLTFSWAGAALANLLVQSMIAAEAGSTGSVMPDTTAFFQIPVWLALFAIAFAAGIGLLAGVLPAVRAANLDPLTALRHE
ncbi:MAG: ABC transporter permease [Coriobacteriia bacterium]|nr:ABC transporter permease [Coriobacteriia bacterium]